MRIEVDSHINPNDAPVGSLVRLPGIGLGKASAIVDFRENPAGGVGPTFKTPSDLEQVKGIGPKTVNAVKQHLSFE
jgi:competence ComEA-like helix-hairpin-helix protein